jgi:hypothetical protein
LAVGVAVGVEVGVAVVVGVEVVVGVAVVVVVGVGVGVAVAVVVVVCDMTPVISDPKQYRSEYSTWRGMKQRCSDPNCASYEYYGAKGVKVCTRWMHFSNFIADMGPKPAREYSIDRLDASKDYEPGNCRWATLTQQQRNKDTTVLLTFQGETLPVAAWADRSGIPYQLLWERIKNGWPLEIAMSAKKYPRAALRAYRSTQQESQNG